MLSIRHSIIAGFIAGFIILTHNAAQANNNANCNYYADTRLNQLYLKDPKPIWDAIKAGCDPRPRDLKRGGFTDRPTSEGQQLLNSVQPAHRPVVNYGERDCDNSLKKTKAGGKFEGGADDACDLGKGRRLTGINIPKVGVPEVGQEEVQCLGSLFGALQGLVGGNFGAIAGNTNFGGTALQPITNLGADTIFQDAVGIVGNPLENGNTIGNAIDNTFTNVTTNLPRAAIAGLPDGGSFNTNFPNGLGNASVAVNQRGCLSGGVNICGLGNILGGTICPGGGENAKQQATAYGSPPLTKYPPLVTSEFSNIMQFDFVRTPVNERSTVYCPAGCLLEYFGAGGYISRVITEGDYVTLDENGYVYSSDWQLRRRTLLGLGTPIELQQAPNGSVGNISASSYVIIRPNFGVARLSEDFLIAGTIDGSGTAVFTDTDDPAYVPSGNPIGAVSSRRVQTGGAVNAREAYPGAGEIGAAEPPNLLENRPPDIADDSAPAVPQT